MSKHKRENNDKYSKAKGLEDNDAQNQAQGSASVVENEKVEIKLTFG